MLSEHGVLAPFDPSRQAKRAERQIYKGQRIPLNNDHQHQQHRKATTRTTSVAPLPTRPKQLPPIKMQYKIVAAVLASFAFGSALANPIDNAGVQARGEQAEQVEQHYPCCGQPHPNWNYRPYWLDGRQFQPRQQGYNYNYANQKGYYDNTQFSGSGFDNRGGW